MDAVFASLRLALTFFIPMGLGVLFIGANNKWFEMVVEESADVEQKVQKIET